MRLQCKSPFFKIVLDYFDNFCNNSSCHGGTWISKLPWKALRSLIQPVFFACQFLLLYKLYLLVVENKPWLHKVNTFSKGNLQDFGIYETLVYPKLTICSPILFDTTKMKSKFHLMTIVLIIMMINTDHLQN